MNHLFVDYPLALKLKEAGFEEPCVGWFVDETLLVDHGFYGSDLADFKGEVVRAPIYQQVFDWLEREGFAIQNMTFKDANVFVVRHENEKEAVFSGKIAHAPEYYKQRKQAWDTAILVALKLLKEKSKSDGR